MRNLEVVSKLFQDVGPVPTGQRFARFGRWPRHLTNASNDTRNVRFMASSLGGLKSDFAAG